MAQNALNREGQHVDVVVPAHEPIIDDFPRWDADAVAEAIKGADLLPYYLGLDARNEEEYDYYEVCFAHPDYPVVIFRK